MKNKYFIVVGTLGILFTSLFTSCKKYVDAGAPVNQLTPDKVYSDSSATLSAVMSLYGNINVTQSELLYTSQYAAMSADEAYYFNNATYDPYRTNTLSAGNLGNSVWYPYWQDIYLANANIQGISASTSYSNIFKNQMIGESEFWRAYCYFNLVNFFGDVPLTVSTDVPSNSKLARSPAAQAYQQIVKDLLDAKNRVSAAYPSIEKARVNKSVVSAFLARVYLYQGNWAAAESEASNVIGSGTYKLETNLNNVFIKTSNETIWQIVSNVSAGITGVTKWGINWLPSGTTPNFVLYDTLAKTFEPNDLRKANWTKSMSYSGTTYYYPYKYKIRTTGTSGNEYYVIFRLAEQYLIRSEARAMQNNIAGAKSDLDSVRIRAGLPASTVATQADVLTALEHERWVELFTEMGDRWFNLKRTKRIDAVLSKTKPGWQPFQALYPIPLQDRQANPYLTDNPGY